MSDAPTAEEIEAAKPVERTPVPANDTGNARLQQPRSKAKRAAKAKPSSADA